MTAQRLKKRGWGCLAIVLSAVPATSYSQATASPVDAVTADVQQVCTQPAAAGQHWTVTGTAAAGTVGVQINSLPQPSGQLTFTGEEWSGVQRVLQQDQAGDNDSYRRCVRELTPLFLAKMPRDPAEVARKLNAFLAAKNLAVPGPAYDDADLGARFGARLLPNAINLSNPILNGSYRALAAQDSNSPIGSFTRFFIEQNGALIAVMIVQTCNGGASIICAGNYTDWKSSLEPIVGGLQSSQLTLSAGGGGPFAGPGGTLTKSIVYDAPWRVYIDRVDSPSGGPSAITLVVANDQQ